MKLLKNKNLKQKGAFLGLDLMMVLAIVAILIAAAVWIGSQVVDRNRTKSEIENLSLIVQKTQELYAQDATYDGLNPQVLINTGSLPPAIVSGGTKIVNSWKNEVTIAPTANKAAFTITTTGVPKSSCVNIANSVRKQANGLQIGSTDIVTNGSLAKDVTVATITTACSGDSNELKITYR